MVWQDSLLVEFFASDTLTFSFYSFSFSPAPLAVSTAHVLVKSRHGSTEYWTRGGIPWKFTSCSFLTYQVLRSSPLQFVFMAILVPQADFVTSTLLVV